MNHMDDIVATCMMINPSMRASFVITQCPSLPNQANRILEAKEVCRTYDINVLDAINYNRNIFDDSEESGFSVIEIEPKGKAASEMRAIACELLEANNATEVRELIATAKTNNTGGNYGSGRSQEKLYAV